jgi:hypothetical protein
MPYPFKFDPATMFPVTLTDPVDVLFIPKHPLPAPVTLPTTLIVPDDELLTPCPAVFAPDPVTFPFMVTVPMFVFETPKALDEPVFSPPPEVMFPLIVTVPDVWLHTKHAETVLLIIAALIVLPPVTTNPPPAVPPFAAVVNVTCGVISTFTAIAVFPFATSTSDAPRLAHVSQEPEPLAALFHWLTESMLTLLF